MVCSIIIIRQTGETGEALRGTEAFPGHRTRKKKEV